jgi:hypothetical protein
MRTNVIVFDGFAAGETDFGALEARSDQDRRDVLNRLLDRIVAGVLAPAGTAFNAIVVVGHSDRQDLARLSCDERRQSEHSAAERRASSAAIFLFKQINERLVNSGNPKIADPNDIQNTTLTAVFAGSGELTRPSGGGEPYATPAPQNEEDRARNRRVGFIVSPEIL